MSCLFIFVHYNLNNKLWIDLDASKNFGFRVVIFYSSTNKEFLQKYWPNNGSIRSIFFFTTIEKSH